MTNTILPPSSSTSALDYRTIQQAIDQQKSNQLQASQTQRTALLPNAKLEDARNSSQLLTAFMQRFIGINEAHRQWLIAACQRFSNSPEPLEREIASLGDFPDPIQKYKWETEVFLSYLEGFLNKLKAGDNSFAFLQNYESRIQAFIQEQRLGLTFLEQIHTISKPPHQGNPIQYAAAIQNLGKELFHSYKPGNLCVFTIPLPDGNVITLRIHPNGSLTIIDPNAVNTSQSDIQFPSASSQKREATSGDIISETRHLPWITLDGIDPSRLNSPEFFQSLVEIALLPHLTPDVNAYTLIYDNLLHFLNAGQKNRLSPISLRNVLTKAKSSSSKEGATFHKSLTTSFYCSLLGGFDDSEDPAYREKARDVYKLIKWYMENDFFTRFLQKLREESSPFTQLCRFLYHLLMLAEESFEMRIENLLRQSYKLVQGLETDSTSFLSSIYNRAQEAKVLLKIPPQSEIIRLFTSFFENLPLVTLPSQIQSILASLLARLKGYKTSCIEEGDLRVATGSCTSGNLNYIAPTQFTSDRPLQISPSSQSHPLVRENAPNNLEKHRTLKSIQSLNFSDPSQIANNFQQFINLILSNRGEYDGDTRNALAFYQELLFKLPAPVRDRVDFWDRIPKEQILPCLRALRFFIHQTSQLSNLPSYKYNDEASAFFMSLDFLLMAILDKLLRRLPETHLNGFAFDIDVKDYDQKLEKLNLSSHHPLIDQKRDAAICYFYPRYSRKDRFNDYVEKTTWQNPFLNYQEFSSDLENFLKRKGPLQSSTYRYFDILLQQARRDQPEKLAHLIPSHLPSANQVALLICAINSNQDVVPESVRIMQDALHATQIYNLPNFDFPHLDIYKPTSSFYYRVEIPTELENVPYGMGYSERSLPHPHLFCNMAQAGVRENHLPVALRYKSVYLEPPNPLNTTSHFTDYDYGHGIGLEGSQDKIISSTTDGVAKANITRDFPSLKNASDAVIKELQMIVVDPFDRVARLIAFFSRNIHALKDEKLLAFCKQIFCHDGGLLVQITDSPSFTNDIESFFTQAVLHFIEYDDPKTALQLIFLANEVMGYVEKIGPFSFTRLRVFLEYKARVDLFRLCVNKQSDELLRQFHSHFLNYFLSAPYIREEPICEHALCLACMDYNNPYSYLSNTSQAKWLEMTNRNWQEWALTCFRRRLTPENQAKILNAIYQTLQCTSENLNWTIPSDLTSPCTFSSSHRVIELNLQKLRLSINGYASNYNPKHILENNEVLKRLLEGEKVDIVPLGGGTLQILNSRYPNLFVKIGESSPFSYQLFKVEAGQTYYLIPPFVPSNAVRLPSFVNPDSIFWASASSGWTSSSQIHIETKGRPRVFLKRTTFSNRYSVECSFPENPSSFLLQSNDIPLLSKMPSLELHSNTLDFWVRKDDGVTQLTRICDRNSDLEFYTRTGEDPTHFYCSLESDYYLSSKIPPSIQDLGFNLGSMPFILDNGRGSQKFLTKITLLDRSNPEKPFTKEAFYSLSIAGGKIEPTNLEEKLTLAYLHLINHQHKKAFDLLHNLNALKPLSPREKDLLQWILFVSQNLKTDETNMVFLSAHAFQIRTFLKFPPSSRSLIEAAANPLKDILILISNAQMAFDLYQNYLNSYSQYNNFRLDKRAELDILSSLQCLAPYVQLLADSYKSYGTLIQLLFWFITTFANFASYLNPQSLQVSVETFSSFLALTPLHLAKEIKQMLSNMVRNLVLAWPILSHRYRSLKSGTYQLGEDPFNSISIYPLARGNLLSTPTIISLLRNYKPEDLKKEFFSDPFHLLRSPILADPDRCFFFLYDIARSGTKEERDKLHTLFTLHTSFFRFSFPHFALIESVWKHPSSYPTLQELQEAIKIHDACEEKANSLRYERGEDFDVYYERRSALKKQAKEALEIFQRVVDTESLFSRIQWSINAALTTLGILFSLCKTAIQVLWHTFWHYLEQRSKRSCVIIPSAIPSLTTLKSPLMSFPDLQQQEQALRDTTTSLFNEYFKTRTREVDEVDPITLRIDTTSKDPLVRERSARAQRALEEYQALRPKTVVDYPLKGSANLPDLKVQLDTKIKGWEGDLARQKQTIKDLANIPPLPKDKESYRQLLAQGKISFEELKRLFADGKQESWKKRLPLHNQKQLQTLYQLLAAYFLLESRLGLTKKAATTVHALLQALREGKPKEEQEALIQQIATGLLAIRSYPLDADHRHMLLYEAAQGHFIRAGQVAKTNEIQDVFTRHKQAVAEMPTDWGKTSYLCTVLSKLIQEGRVIFNCWPSSIEAVNARDNSHQMEQDFAGHADALHFQRDLYLTYEMVIRLYEELMSNITEGTPINIRSETLRSLRNHFIILFQSLSKINPSLRRFTFLQPMLEQVCKYLKVLRTHGFLFWDEAHDGTNPFDVLIYSLGNSIPMQEYEINLIDDLFRLMSLDDVLAESFQLAFKEKRIKEYPLLATMVAEKMAGKFRLSNEQMPSFIAFVTGKNPHVPSWISNSPYRQEISLLKGVLSLVLPHSLSGNVDENYGLSRDHLDEVPYAIPYKGSSQPNEDKDRLPSEFQNRHVTLVDTFLTYLCNGLSKKQCYDLLAWLQNSCHNEVGNGIPVGSTLAYRLFQSIFPTRPDLRLLQLKEKDFDSLYPDLLRNKSAILTYVRHLVAPLIKRYPRRVTCTAQEFRSLFNQVLMVSATIQDPRAHAKDSASIPMKGSVGGMLHIAYTKLRVAPFRTIQASLEKDVLATSHALATASSDSRALLDVGGLLRGIPNRRVAEYLCTHFTTNENPGGIRYVIYFDEERQGFMLMDVAHPETIRPLEQCHYLEDEVFTVYDALRTKGSNLNFSPLARGIILLGGKRAESSTGSKDAVGTTLEAFLQGVGRMMRRGYNSQQFSVAIPVELSSVLEKDQKPAESPMDPLLRHLLTQSAYASVEYNYQALIQQMRALITSSMIDKLMGLSSSQDDPLDMDLLVRMFQCFESELITEDPSEPYTLYANLGNAVATGEVLNQELNRLLAKVDALYYFSKAEKEALKAQLCSFQSLWQKDSTYALPKEVQTTSVPLDLQCHVIQEQRIEVQQVEEEQPPSEVKRAAIFWDPNINLFVPGWEKVNNTFFSILQIFLNWKPILVLQDWYRNFQLKYPKLAFISRFALYLLPAYMLQLKMYLIGVSLLLGLLIKDFAAKYILRLFNMHLTISPVSTVLQKSGINLPSGFFSERLLVTNNFWHHNEENPEIPFSSSQKPLFQVAFVLDENATLQGILLGQDDAIFLRHKLTQDRFARREEVLSRKRCVILCDLNGSIVAQGQNKVELETLRKNPQFVPLLTQAKLIAGSLDYNPEELNVLEALILKMGVTHFTDFLIKIVSQKDPLATNSPPYLANYPIGQLLIRLAQTEVAS